MRNRTIKQTSTYRNAALIILRNAGAQLHKTGFYMYSVETTLGALSISVRDDSLMCRFEDVDRAKGYFGDYSYSRLNPHTGKWNWMGGMNHEGDLNDLQDFGNALELILPEGRTPNPTLPLASYAA
ncbi:hypothetical protein [Pseudomonas serbica]|uniref:hypothetical protein n=1 Tax=Pseudomonas serbica TaxID=2965074 RepID=UPI00237B0167|nr:hypothetical protein [Pseudomonas serbica]